jgi:uncharacterized protein involved in exopolysaccharide biosynthesis
VLSQQADVASEHLTFSRWIAGVVVRWRIVARALGVVAVIAIAAVLFVPPVYRAQVLFITNPSSNGKLASALSGGAIAGLASQMGLSGTPGADPSETPAFYDQLVHSRELITRVLTTRFLNPRTEARDDSATLLEILRIKHDNPRRRMEIGVKKLRDGVNTWFDVKTSFVRFSVDTRWPELSAAVANQMMKQVEYFNREQRRSRASEKRASLEKRLDIAKERLQEAESARKEFLTRNTVVNSPHLQYQNMRLERSEENASDLYNLLLREFESAQMDEFDDKPLITVVDTAVVPYKPEWPRYGLVGMSAIAVGLLIGLILAGIATLYSAWQARDPSDAQEFEGAVAAMKGGFRHPFRRRKVG